jgi:hypothetical protein
MSDTSVSESTERSDGDRGGVDMIESGVRVRLIVVVAVVGSGLWMPVRAVTQRSFKAYNPSLLVVTADIPFSTIYKTYTSLRMCRHVMVPVDAG